MFKDFRYALRLLTKAPAFTALALVVMTCGLSISIYMASLMNTLVYKALPFPESENIVTLDKMLNGMRFDWGQVAAADMLEISDKNNTLDELLFYSSFNANLSIEETSKRIQGLVVEPGVFEFTNTLPLLGRTLRTDDIRENALTNAVISYKLWNDHFALNEEIIGKTLRVNEQTVTVVGVMPEGYFREQ